MDKIRSSNVNFQYYYQYRNKHFVILQEYINYNLQVQSNFNPFAYFAQQYIILFQKFRLIFVNRVSVCFLPPAFKNNYKIYPYIIYKRKLYYYCCVRFNNEKSNSKAHPGFLLDGTKSWIKWITYHLNASGQLNVATAHKSTQCNYLENDIPIISLLYVCSISFSLIGFQR